ncbi:MAG: hypothetical protein ACTHNP_01400 [Solirubrobacterales bacterium]
MNCLKILGLAAIVAAALTALAGAGTAGATVFCPTTSTPCQSKPYEVGTAVDANLSNKAIIENILGEALVQCTEGTLKGKLAHEGSGTETVLGTVESLTWGKCNAAIATVAEGFYEVHSIVNTDNGTVTGGNTEVTFDILTNISCTYSVEREDLGTLKGGAPATLDINADLTKTGGGNLCPGFVFWTAEYKFAEPLPLYVESK